MIRVLNFATTVALAVVLTSSSMAQNAADKRDKAGSAAAKPAMAAASMSPAAPPDDKPAGNASAGIVEGFRSAKFGMNEADIRAAITKDFGARPDAIKPQENQAELTHSLVVSVPDLLIGGGTADVSYVMGYKSKTLTQVGAIWSKGTDPAMTPERLFSNANILRAHFLGEGFKPETVTLNTPVNGGLLIFRGSDAKGRSVILLLQGTFETKDNQRTLTPTGLLLFYMADAKSPDVFRLPPGQF